MGLKYKPCNDELDSVFQEATTKPLGQPLSAPWLAGKSLLGLGRVGLIAACDAGAGLAKNSAGHYKLYYSRSFTGVWNFEYWGLAKTAFWGSLWMTFLYVVMEQYFGGHWSSGAPVPMSGTVPYKTIFLGLVGLFVFGGRGIFCNRHAKLALATGVHEDIAAASINFAVLVLSIAALIKGCSSVGVDHIANNSVNGQYAVTASSLWGAAMSVPGGIIGEFGKFFNHGVLVGLGVACLVLFVFPMGLALAAWIVMWCGFWPMSAKMMYPEIIGNYGHNPVVVSACNESGLTRLADMQQPGILMALGTYCLILGVGFAILIK